MSQNPQSIEFNVRMFRCIFLIAVLASQLPHLACASDNNKLQFILDFLKAQSQPTHPIIWHDCFAIHEKFELVKSSFNPTTFNRQDSLNRRDFGVNSQYYLFILDLECAQSPEGIIQKVTSTVFILNFIFHSLFSLLLLL